MTILNEKFWMLDESALPKAFFDIETTKNSVNLTVSKGLGIIEFSGVLLKNPGLFDRLFSDVVDSEELLKMLEKVEADDSIKKLLIKTTSPGGETSLILEIMQAIDKVKMKKSVVGYAQDLAASAAFFVLSKCEKIFSNEIAKLGSIGVYTVILDQSEAAKSQGYKVHMIASGKNKGVGEPGTEITAEQIEPIQMYVNDLFDIFKKEMGRTVSEDMLDGKTVVAQRAIAAGLIDGIEPFENIKKIMEAEIMENEKILAELEQSKAKALELEKAFEQQKALLETIQKEKAELEVIRKKDKAESLINKWLAKGLSADKIENTEGKKTVLFDLAYASPETFDKICDLFSNEMTIELPTSNVGTDSDDEIDQTMSVIKRADELMKTNNLKRDEALIRAMSEIGFSLAI